jgi:pimeloyl-ACP methyl ester carboxylesterase
MTDSSNVQHRTIETNGIRMHIAEAGSGPLVVLLHGLSFSAQASAAA